MAGTDGLPDAVEETWLGWLCRTALVDGGHGAPRSALRAEDIRGRRIAVNADHTPRDLCLEQCKGGALPAQRPNSDASGAVDEELAARRRELLRAAAVFDWIERAPPYDSVQ